MAGYAEGDGFRVGFGEVLGKIVPCNRSSKQGSDICCHLSHNSFKSVAYISFYVLESDYVAEQPINDIVQAIKNNI